MFKYTAGEIFIGGILYSSVGKTDMVWQILHCLLCTHHSRIVSPHNPATPPKMGNKNMDVIYVYLEFYGPKMALVYRLDAISQGPKKSRFPGPNPLPLALVMYLHASKTLRTGPYKA
jgi:hypothetical protein